MTSVQLDLRENSVMMETLGHQDFKDLQVHQALKDQKVRPEERAMQDSMVYQEQRDLEVTVFKVIEENPVFLDCRANLDQLEILDLKVHTSILFPL